MASELKGGSTVGGYRIWHAGSLTKEEFAAAIHNHDDRYYTETESNGRFLGIGATAAAATKLATARTISLTGDVTGSVSFDGSGNVNIATTYKNSGVTAGTYRSVTVDAKGNITAGSNPTTISGYGITDAALKSHTHTISSEAQPTSGLYDGLLWQQPSTNTVKVCFNGQFHALGGGAKARTYPRDTKILKSSASVSIGIPNYVKGVDTLFAFQNSTFIMEGTDYTVSSDGTTITKTSGTWDSGTTFQFIVIAIETTDGLMDTIEIKRFPNKVKPAANTTTIPIGILFDADKDILDVYQDGILLYPDDQYSLSSNKQSIVLNGYSADGNNVFYFSVIKRVRVGA